MSQDFIYDKIYRRKVKMKALRLLNFGWRITIRWLAQSFLTTTTKIPVISDMETALDLIVNYGPRHAKACLRAYADMIRVFAVS